jgi:hypothetical protein
MGQWQDTAKAKAKAKQEKAYKAAALVESVPTRNDRDPQTTCGTGGLRGSAKQAWIPPTATNYLRLVFSVQPVHDTNLCLGTQVTAEQERQRKETRVTGMETERKRRWN